MKPQLETDRTALAWHLGGALLCLSLLISGWVFGVAPLLSDSMEQDAIVAEAAEAEAQAKLAKAEHDKLAKDLQDIDQHLEAQPISLEPASKINPLLARLASWSDMHGLTITKTQAGQPVALAHYDYIPIQIAGEGGFGELRAFLSYMYEHRRDLGVVSFHLRRQPATGSIAFDLDMAWYVSSVADEDRPQATASVPTN